MRRLLLEAVFAHPGRSLTEIRSDLGIGWASLYEHVRALEGALLIDIVVAGRRRLVFPHVRGRAPLRAVDAIVAVKAPAARRLAEEIASRPGQDVLQLSDSTGETPRVVYYHVRRMMLGGLIQSRGGGRMKNLHPTERLVALLQP